MADIEKKMITLNLNMIKNKIYHVRGERVMLDFELAEIYGYETKRFNEQVKRNIEKFDSDFMFQLTDDETQQLSRSHFATLNKKNGRGSNIKYKPYAFTEQGIYMLMTVLKGELAIKQSKALIRMFKQMKNYIIENRDFIDSNAFVRIVIQTNQNSTDISEIKSQMATKAELKKVMDNFIDPDTYKHFLIMNGKKTEANIAYKKIYKSAKHTVYVADNYIGLKTVELLREVKQNVCVTVFSDNIKSRTMLTAAILKDFKTDYPNISIEFRKTNGKYHDRYIAVDYNTQSETLYHCGASSKDAGDKITTILRIDDKSLYHFMFDELLSNPALKI